MYFSSTLAQQNWAESTGAPSHKPPIAHHMAFPSTNTPHQSDTVTTLNEPTLACHHYPKSTVYIRVYFCWCTLCGFGQIYHDMYPPWWYLTEEFCCPKNALCFTHSSVPCPQTLATTNLSSVSMGVPFQNIIQLESYSMQPLQTGCFPLVMPFSSLRVLSWLDRTFLFSSE